MGSLWFLHLVSVSFSEESMMKTSLISGLILLIVYSCARNEDTLDKYTIAGSKGGIDTTAPTVSSNSPSNSDTSVSVSLSISVTFSESMDTTSVTTNSSGTSCTGTLQVSSDNFSSCVQMSSSPTVSNSNKTFTSSSAARVSSCYSTYCGSLSFNTIYKIRIGTGVKDISGNSLATQFTSNVFKTIGTSFTARTITTSADGAQSVYAVDLDGDGDIDVLSASGTDDKSAWYENDGSESFTSRTITTSADGAYSVYAVDLDGDGDMDVLSASFFDAKIAWYENSRL